MGDKKPSKTMKKTKRSKDGRKDVSIEESDGDSQSKMGPPPTKGATRRPRRAPSRDGRPKEAEKEETMPAVDKFVDMITDLGVDGLRKMFKNDLSMLCPPLSKGSAFELPENQGKNRYVDIVCLEKTRVVLEKENEGEGDYIHANWVKFDKHDRTYIATQGPLESTCADFWRMIWQKKSPTIVCLTKVVEANKQKCAQYWPETAGDFLNHGPIKVINKKNENFRLLLFLFHVESEDKFTIHTFDVSYEGCADGLNVNMINVTSWPDKGIPLSGLMILRMIRCISTVDPLAVGPVVVHCSAGVSRTGTIILIDVIQKRIFKSGMQVDLPDLFKSLRMQRASCIQKEGHFVFMISCVLDYIKAGCPGRYDQKMKKFKEDFEKAQMFQA